MSNNPFCQAITVTEGNCIINWVTISLNTNLMLQTSHLVSQIIVYKIKNILKINRLISIHPKVFEYIIL